MFDAQVKTLTVYKTQDLKRNIVCIFFVCPQYEGPLLGHTDCSKNSALSQDGAVALASNFSPPHYPTLASTDEAKWPSN